MQKVKIGIEFLGVVLDGSALHPRIEILQTMDCAGKLLDECCLAAMQSSAEQIEKLGDEVTYQNVNLSSIELL